MWTYFDSQHDLILTNMKEAYETAVQTIKGACCGVPARL